MKKNVTFFQIKRRKTSKWCLNLSKVSSFAFNLETWATNDWWSWRSNRRLKKKAMGQLDQLELSIWATSRGLSPKVHLHYQFLLTLSFGTYILHLPNRILHLPFLKKTPTYPFYLLPLLSPADPFVCSSLFPTPHLLSSSSLLLKLFLTKLSSPTEVFFQLSMPKVLAQKFLSSSNSQRQVQHDSKTGFSKHFFCFRNDWYGKMISRTPLSESNPFQKACYGFFFCFWKGLSITPFRKPKNNSRKPVP